MRTRLKVCCIADHDEAATAVRLGACALGLVAVLPSGARVLDEHTLPALAATIPPPVARFLLTSSTAPEEIVAQAVAARVDTVQLADEVPLSVYQALRRGAPHVRIAQVLHVQGPEVVPQAQSVAPHVDALILDSGTPKAEVPVFGGTGRVHDWSLSRQVVTAVGIPVFLAGGITAANVGLAVEQVRPFGIDVCSGVRSDGRLDPAKLSDLVRALVAADLAALDAHVSSPA